MATATRWPPYTRGWICAKTTKRMKKIWLSKWTKVLLFLLCLLPFFNLVWRFYHQKLTANPIEFITHYTGDWIIRFLLITLAITPLRAILNQPQLIRFRRMLG